MTYRPKLFAGIELDERTRAACAAVSARLQDAAFPGRFEAAEKLHITLAFLGWVDAERVEAIRDTLRAVAQSQAPFDITLDRVGAFPHERRPRIVWIGSHDQGEGFRRVARAAQAAYAGMGFSFTQDAVAHVTIARVKEGRAHLPMLDIRPVRMRVSHISLFESLPAARTTRYEVRDRAALNG